MKMLANGLLLTGLLFSPIAFASACDTGPHRQFDFWLGEWSVSVEGKGQVGHNRIEKIVDGCALRETYTTAGKYHGTSYNSYSPVTGQWHQTWVDNSGLTLLLSGGWNKGAMVLSGSGLSPSGKKVIHRITWTPLPDGRVRQLWESRAEDPKDESWMQVFDGYYSPVGQ